MFILNTSVFSNLLMVYTLQRTSIYILYIISIYYNKHCCQHSEFYNYNGTYKICMIFQVKSVHISQSWNYIKDNNNVIFLYDVIQLGVDLMINHYPNIIIIIIIIVSHV